jgi:transcriptional regulator with XRE-family HTH domain
VKKSIYSEEQRAVQRLLIKLRKERDLRQEDLAERLEESQQFVSRYEKGQKILDFPELAQICEALGVSLIDFVDRYQKELSVTDTDEHVSDSNE